MLTLHMHTCQPSLYALPIMPRTYLMLAQAFFVLPTLCLTQSYPILVCLVHAYVPSSLPTFLPMQSVCTCLLPACLHDHLTPFRVPTVCMIPVTIPAMIMFFENRYNYLVRKDHMTRGRKIKRLLYFSLLYILSVITFIPPVIDNPNRVEVLEASHRKFPCLPPEIIDNPRLFVMGTDNNTFIACVVPYIIIGWVQILGFFVGTVNFIYRTKTMSLHTSNLQKKFFKSLCIQIAVPLVVLLIPESYILNTAISGNMDVGLTNILMIWMASHGLFSTVVMLIVHKPYRKATLSILGRPQAIKTAPVSIISKLFTR